MNRTSSLANTLAGAAALAAWCALFHFGGVTDIGYDASRPDPSAFNWIAERWRGDFRDTAYALNFLAPVLALWLAWRRRAILATGPHRASWAGCMILVIGLALHALGAKAQQTRITLFAMIVTLYGAAWFAWGRPAARGLAAPAAALLFALPLNFFDQVINPFRVASAALAALLASGFGLPVAAAGSLLIESEQGAWTLDLADSTGSIFALLAVTMWSVVLAELALPSWRRRLALLAMTPAFFWLANIARGLILCALAEGISPDFARRAHADFSTLLLTVGFLPLQLLAVRLLRMKRGDFKARFKALTDVTPHQPPPSNQLEGLP